MEPTKAPLKIYLGDFEVVQCKLGTITLSLGNNVHATVHLIDNIQHQVKPGDKLPLFTELSYAVAGNASIQ